MDVLNKSLIAEEKDREGKGAARGGSEEETSPPVHYIQFLHVSSNEKINGFALAGEVLVISGEETISREVMEELSINENTKDISSIPNDNNNNNHEASAQRNGKINLDKDREVVYNGVKYDLSCPLPSSTYLEQSHVDSSLYDHLTVREVLQFAEAIRTSMVDVSPSVMPETIECLQLQDILDTQVQLLSRVERYLVMLGAEVVTRKQVFFLDNPILGLTLPESEVVLRGIREIARVLRRIVVITMSNFSQSHVAYVHRLLLVSSTGMVFFGRAEEANKLFVDHSPPLKIDIGISYSELLFKFLSKKQLDDDEFTPYWDDDDLTQHRNEEVLYSLRTLPMKRESSFSPFTATSSPSSTSNRATQHPTSSISLCGRLLFYLRTMYWLFWRAFVVRSRNHSHLLAQLIYTGITPGAGLAVTFSHLEYTVSGFQDRCAFLTVIAYGIAIIQNSWYIYDITDWGVYLFERSRFQHLPVNAMPTASRAGDFFNAGSYLLLFPFLSVLADLIVLRIFPPIVTCVIVYLFVGLNESWHAKVTFFGTIILLSIVGVLLCRCIVVLNLLGKTSEVQARSSITSTSIFCFLVLYAGFLLSPADLPSSKIFIRDWSMYYWGCNNLYYSQLSDKYFASVEQSNEARINTTHNHTVYVTDVPLICNTLTPWCDYCNTSHYDHPIVFPNPNYTCSFNTVVDLCELDDGAFENKSFCVKAASDSNVTTTTEVANGRALLESLAIVEIGEERVYWVLCRQGGFYLGLFVLLCSLLNRKENHRFYSRVRRLC